MKTNSYPIVTGGVVTLLAAMFWLVPEQSLLYFDADAIARGEAWRLITGHLTHADQEHLFWNSLGLAVLGSLIEQRSRALLLTALALGIMAVNILLLTPFAVLKYYCGLSGALNTLLVVALWLEWQRTRSWLVVAIAVGCVLKTVIEVSQGISITTRISWPPFAWSHVAGMLGGLILVWVSVIFPFTSKLAKGGRTRSAATPSAHGSAVPDHDPALPSQPVGS